MTRTFALIGRAMMRPKLKLARDLGTLWVGQVMTKGVAFIAFAILARRLLPDHYGAVEYAMGLATLATLAIEGGLGAVGVRRLTQGQQSADELVALIPAAQLCLAAIIAPSMMLFTWFFTDDPNAFVLTCAVALSLVIVPWKQDWLFQAKGMMIHIVTGQSIRVLTFMLGCLLLVNDNAHILWVGFAEILSVLLATLYLSTMQHRLIVPVRIRFALHKLADLFREGVAIGLGAICWALFQYTPLLILAAMAGMTDTAYFGAAHRLGVSLVTFSWLYHFNLYPVISRRVNGNPAALAQLTRMSVRVTSWGGIGLALVLTLISEPLLRLLFGPGFEKAALPFSLLVWTFPLTMISGHARWILVADKRGSDALVAQVSGVLTSVPAAMLLVGPFGTAGAAAAMSLACAVVWAVSQYYTHIRGHDVPVLPALPAIAMAALVIAATHMLDLDPWTAGAAGIIVFGIAALLFDHHIISEIRQLVSGQPPAAPQSPMGESPEETSTLTSSTQAH